MDCPNCGEPLETGAAFCGNCGQAILQPPQDDKTPATQIDTIPTVAAVDEQSTQPVTQPLTPETPPVSTPDPPQPTLEPPVPPVSAIAQGWANQSKPDSTATMRGGSLAVAASAGIPSYAVPIVDQQNNNIKATMAPILGVVGIVGALFIPLVGLGLGITGVVLGTLSRHAVRRRLSTLGIIVSSLAIIAGLASWAYVIEHDSRLNHKAASNASAVNNGPVRSAASVITPCYSVNFIGTLNVQNVSGSCDMNAFNGNTFDNSTDAYKIYGTVSSVLPASFLGLAKQAIEKDVAQTLPNFTITLEKSGSFAASPAYFVTASNGQGVSVMEAAALHTTTNGDNFFVFVHAINGQSVNLNDLQSGWQWQ